MLHILLLILKIIGIILAVILGILVLLVCICFFVPVRYEINSRCGGTLSTLKIKGKVTWLCSLVRADIYYKENKLKWRLRIAWKKFLGGQDYKADGSSHEMPPGTAGAQNKRTEGEESEEDEKRDEEVRDWNNDYEESSEEAWDEAEEDREADEEIRESGLCESEKNPEGKESDEKAGDQSGEGKKDSEEFQEKFVEDEEIYEEIFKDGEEEDSGSEERAYGRHEAYEEPDRENGGWLRGIGRKVKGIIRKIKGLYNQIRCTIKNICAKIKELLEKKDRLFDFIRDETHVGAFRKAKKEVFGLLWRLRPKKILLEARFGFEDPSWTGRMLAVIAPLYPFSREWISLKPDFTKKVLAGMLYAKGRIRFCHFIVFLWNLFWCKNVRRTYRDIKNFKL